MHNYYIFNRLIDKFELKMVNNINYIFGYDEHGLCNFKAKSSTGKIHKTSSGYVKDIDLEDEFATIESCEGGWMLVPEVPF